MRNRKVDDDALTRPKPRFGPARLLYPMHRSELCTFSPLCRNTAVKTPALTEPSLLLYAERLAVCALIHGRILFMGTNLNLLQRTEILCSAVVLTLVYAASDRRIGTVVGIHHLSSPPFTQRLSLVWEKEKELWSVNFEIASIGREWYYKQYDFLRLFITGHFHFRQRRDKIGGVVVPSLHLNRISRNVS